MGKVEATPGQVMASERMLLDLELGSPEHRRHLVLTLLQESLGLDLRSQNGRRAILTDADFSVPADVTRLDSDTQRNVRGGVISRESNLSHAWMDRTNWTGADLSGSDLSSSRARQARFDEAMLEGVNFDQADLVGSTFRSARLGEASFRRSLLEEAVFSRASLRFANFSGAVLEGARFENADLWGAVLDGASLEGADLSGATLTEGSLKNATLTRANLTGADLGKADLTGADLTDADLRGARLGGARLDDARLCNARLEGTDLSTCGLTHVHLSNAWLERTRLVTEQLGECVGEELARQYEPARRAYLSLQRNFETLGNGDAASWAYGRRRRMQKQEDRQAAFCAWQARRRGRAVSHYLNYLSDQGAEWLCDYGESVARVAASMVLMVLLFALLYGLSGGVIRITSGTNDLGAVTRAPVDMTVFSLLALASSGNAAGLVAGGTGVRLMSALETFLGIGLTGLLGFVLGNRINR